MKCPCKDCDGRTLTCHSVCTKYKEWKSEREQFNDARRLERDAESYHSAKRARLRGAKK